MNDTTIKERFDKEFSRYGGSFGNTPKKEVREFFHQELIALADQINKIEYSTEDDEFVFQKAVQLLIRTRANELSA